MPQFAEYEPLRRSAPPPDGLVLRRATPADVGDLAAVRAARDGMPEAVAAQVFRRQLAAADAGSAVVVAAFLESAMAGYGVAERLEREGLPEGWYLGGVVVVPALRRRGIGARLTRERLDWIAARAPRALYFASERNRASIDLHAAFGFREIARDIRGPGLTFTGGVGLLFAVDLPPPAPSGPEQGSE